MGLCSTIFWGCGMVAVTWYICAITYWASLSEESGWIGGDNNGGTQAMWRSNTFYAGGIFGMLNFLTLVGAIAGYFIKLPFFARPIFMLTMMYSMVIVGLAFFVTDRAVPWKNEQAVITADGTYQGAGGLYGAGMLNAISTSMMTCGGDRYLFDWNDDEVMRKENGRSLFDYDYDFVGELGADGVRRGNVLGAPNDAMTQRPEKGAEKSDKPERMEVSGAQNTNAAAGMMNRPQRGSGYGFGYRSGRAGYGVQNRFGNIAPQDRKHDGVNLPKGYWNNGGYASNYWNNRFSARGARARTNTFVSGGNGIYDSGYGVSWYPWWSARNQWNNHFHYPGGAYFSGYNRDNSYFRWGNDEWRTTTNRDQTWIRRNGGNWERWGNDRYWHYHKDRKSDWTRTGDHEALDDDFDDSTVRAGELSTPWGRDPSDRSIGKFEVKVPAYVFHLYHGGPAYYAMACLGFIFYFCGFFYYYAALDFDSDGKHASLV